MGRREPGEQALRPHFFVDGHEFTGLPLRVGVYKVTGQTNERSVLCTLLPSGFPSGYSLNIAHVDRAPEAALCLIAALNSFVCDFLLRQKISTNITQASLLNSPVARPPTGSDEFSVLADRTARLVPTFMFPYALTATFPGPTSATPLGSVVRSTNIRCRTGAAVARPAPPVLADRLPSWSPRVPAPSSPSSGHQ